MALTKVKYSNILTLHTTLTDIMRCFYLCIHEQVSHQSHGLAQSIPLGGQKGVLFVAHGVGSHEVSDLVVQAVQRLHSWREQMKDGSESLLSAHTSTISPICVSYFIIVKFTLYSNNRPYIKHCYNFTDEIIALSFLSDNIRP